MRTNYMAHRQWLGYLGGNARCWFSWWEDGTLHVSKWTWATEDEARFVMLVHKLGII